MKYTQLQRILRSIRPQLHCPTCQKAFQLSDLEIIELVDQDIYLCAQCETCQVTVEAEILGLEGGQPQLQIYQDDRVSKKDIENISLALNTHKGSLRKLLSKKKAKKE